MAFKAQIVLEALRETKTIAQISAEGPAVGKHAIRRCHAEMGLET